MDSLQLNIKLSLMRTHGLDMVCECFIKLQFRYGIRINDLRRIERRNILSTGVIIVPQSKGSESLLCTIVEDREFWLAYRSGMYTDIKIFTYSFFYKLYKRYGLSIYSEVGGNSSVTHSARKSLARSLYEETNDISVSQCALGHKSSNSTMYYLTQDQRKNELKRGVLSAPIGKIDRFKVEKRNGKDFIYIK